MAGKDVFETVLEDPYIMSGAGAAVGAVAGRAVGRRVNRGMNNKLNFNRWRANFKRENGRSPTREEVQEFKQYEGHHGYAKRAQEDYGDAALPDAREVTKRFVRGKGPAAVGAVGGGALGFGYSQGRKRR